jgi:hypothetical protein
VDVGFEPTVPLPALRFSRPAHSAALPTHLASHLAQLPILPYPLRLGHTWAGKRQVAGQPPACKSTASSQANHRRRQLPKLPGKCRDTTAAFIGLTDEKASHRPATSAPWQAPQHNRGPVVVHRTGDLRCRRLGLFVGLTHSNTSSGPGKHLTVVMPIPDRHCVFGDYS